MIICLSICLCCALLAIGLLMAKTRRVLRDLEDAVRLKRCLLLDKPSANLRRLGFEGLILQTNDLIERYRRHVQQQSGHSSQLQATLGSIQEAVIIFNDQHLIEFANESAQGLFPHAHMRQGLRLEALVRSSELLEFLTRYRRNPDERRDCLQAITVERQGEVRWFEVSCAEVRGVSAPNARSTLLVLHEITRLKRLEEMRRDFVANVSHELRTPLTIIKGFAETLAEDDATLSAATRTRFLDKIVNNAERLYLLVEDLLVLSRLESQPDPIKLSRQSLRPLLDEVLEHYRSRLSAGTQRIVLEFDPRVETFAFDRLRVHQVFENLIENVFRHAPEFTLLTLRIVYTDTPPCVQCTVADDGPGIPEKDAPHIFERFYRVDKGRSRERGGTGLGLSIIKHIVQQHRGSVSVESHIGQGTAIHFHLPYVQTRPADSAS